MGIGCFRREFKVANLGLEHPHPALFVSNQWNWHPLIFLLWRNVAMVYFVVWIILSGTWEYDWFTTNDNKPKWFIYLTNWGFLALTLSVIAQAFAVGSAYAKRISTIGYQPLFPGMTWYLKANWLLYNVSTNTALVITVSYWIFIYYPGMPLHPVDFVAHATNSIYVILDFVITAMPIRLCHAWHGTIFAITYLIFNVVYYSLGGTSALDKPYIYSTLDWSEPGSAAFYGVLLAVPAPIGLWVVVWVMHCARAALYRRLHKGGDLLEDEEGSGKHEAIWNSYGSTDADDYEV